MRESEEFFDYYYDTIRKSLAEGRIKPYPIELIGSMLYQNIVAVMNLIEAGTDPAKHGEIIQNGFDIFWDGIKADERFPKKVSERKSGEIQKRCGNC